MLPPSQITKHKRGSSDPLFDRLDVIPEEPVEGEVEPPAEHDGVQEDAQDQELLRHSDQIIIHYLKE